MPGCGLPEVDWRSQQRGFEIGWHGASPITSTREETKAGRSAFASFSAIRPFPLRSITTVSKISIGAWAAERAGPPVAVSTIAPRHRSLFAGDIPGDPRYWSDLFRQHVKYVRNFVFSNINTLAMCPFMPNHDPARPDVNYWCASEGANVESFNKTISEANQDRLEAEGGACIMYTHFAYRFVENGALYPGFRSLMERISKKNGWFVPVATLRDF